MSLYVQLAFCLAIVFVTTATVVAAKGVVVGLTILAVGALIGAIGAKLLTT